MALLNKLKSLLGLDDGQSGSDRQGTDDVGVTVERESGSTEAADEEAPPATPAPGTEAAEPEPAAKSEPEPTTDSDPDPDVEPEVESPPTEDTVEESPEELDGRGSTDEPEPEPSSGPAVDSEADTQSTEDGPSDADEEPLVESESEPIETVEPEPEVENESEEAGVEPEPDSIGSATEDDTGALDEEVLREIKGIGPSYATKLSEAGVDSAADLAAADADELSEATGLSEKRIQGWIDRAKAR